MQRSTTPPTSHCPPIQYFDNIHSCQILTATITNANYKPIPKHMLPYFMQYRPETTRQPSIMG